MTYVINSLNTIKSKLLFIGLLLITTVNYAQDAAPANAGVLSFETEEIDYGTIQQNASGERTFKFKNTGKSPIVITNVQTSCGCTVPEYAKTPVLAGQSSEIKVKYDTNRLGVFKKTITVVSNASEPSKVIRIKGEVIQKTE